MPKIRNKNEPLKRDMLGGFTFVRADEGEAESDSEESRVIELSFSSEAPCDRWFGPEILLHEGDAVDLTRLNEIGVVLFNHNSDLPIGRILSVELDENEHKTRATIELDSDDTSELVYQKIRSGTLKGVSVGYRVHEWAELDDEEKSENGRFVGPAYIATKWEPYEISIVSVPADPDVGVGRQMEEGKGDVNNMPKVNESVQPEVTVQDEVRQVEPMTVSNDDAVKAERERSMEITAICRNFDMDADEFIRSGASVDEVNRIVLGKLAEERKATQISVQVDESDKFRAAAADGLAIRAGIMVDKPAPGAEDFRGKRLLRLAAECCERFQGISTANMSDEDIVRAALTGSGQFPGILSNTANKSMAQSYQTAPTTFQLWTGKGSNADFKTATRYRLSEADELEEITEGGEFKHAEVTEASATASVATYGKSFSLTRKAIINDDLGALSTIPALYGAAARRMINKMVYAILTSNPTIEGAALFHNNHKNLSAVDLNVAGLGTMKAKMARQKNIGGKEDLNIQPAFLIVPPELEVTAAQLISSVVDPTKANATPNPFANRLSVVSDPALATATEFYLAAAPGYCPTIEVTYLNGVETPTMESAVQFDTLGIKWRIYHDVGVNLLDFRGLAKSTGA